MTTWRVKNTSILCTVRYDEDSREPFGLHVNYQKLYIKMNGSNRSVDDNFLSYDLGSQDQFGIMI